MPISSLAIVALTLGELAFEGVDLAVQGPPWPWGTSPGVETSEGPELASECVKLALEFVDLVSEGVDDFEMDVRKHFTRLVSPPHLEDALLVFVFATTSSSVLISPASTHWVAGAPRKGLSSMVLCPLPSGASPTASGATGGMSPSNVFSP